MHGHTSPQCLLSLREMPKVVGNYEDLTPQEKQSVPIASYLPAKTDFSHALPAVNPAWYVPAPVARPASQGNDPNTTYAGLPDRRANALVVEELGSRPPRTLLRETK